jgi:hypothetical protein
MVSFSWSKDRERCLTISAWRYPHKKKSQVLKSGERGGHGTASCKETTRPGNTFKIARGRRAVWAVAPSCWNQKSSRLCSSPSSSIFGRRKFSNMSVSIGIHSNCDSTLFKKVRLNDAYRRQSTPNGHFWAVKRLCMGFSRVFSSPVAKILFVHCARKVDIF